jgi:hypothetical protein
VVVVAVRDQIRVHMEALVPVFQILLAKATVVPVVVEMEVNVFSLQLTVPMVSAAVAAVAVTPITEIAIKMHAAVMVVQEPS